MNISRVIIKNFRGVQTASIILSKHSVLIGDNNVGKTTVLEAIDLVLGPDRLNRKPPIDEHDFYQGIYISDTPTEEMTVSGEAEAAVEADSSNAEDNVPSDAPCIEIEVTIVDLTEEQKGKFGNYTEFWNKATDAFYVEANPEGVDAESPRMTNLLCFPKKTNRFADSCICAPFALAPAPLVWSGVVYLTSFYG
jgi:putative ATP-dependent endonuclease of OLD family